jgi:glutathione S-transferase
MEADQVLHQQMPTTYRQLQPQINHGLQHGQPQLSHQNLAQNGIDLSGLDNEAVFQQLQNASHSHVYHTANQYNPNHAQQHMHQQATASPHTPQQQTSNHQYPVLAPGPIQNNAIQRIQGDNIFGSPDESDQKSVGHLNLKIVLDPPNLEEWRNKLFNVDEMITLSEEEYVIIPSPIGHGTPYSSIKRYQTYFTYVDNVYSHRSTQRYKRKPFVSHYWDCRLKGRPPGTPKSEDPNKKKRKRTARERDLCDVKIKVTEYFPGAMLRQDFVPDGDEYGANPQVQLQGHGQTGTYLSTASDGVVSAHPGSTGRRYYTIQRVNGNGGNGKGDGVAGPHKHTLEESDRVKKNSVQRHLIQKEKDEKKTLVRTCNFSQYKLDFLYINSSFLGPICPFQTFLTKACFII